ncbi:hypothetical protein IC229_07860 [Spirosoma sp. BT702]|uniref:Uncharacterized protein n=1 Tax=Spirosoma profusum TaxID=2771354 RepID=A0A927AS14_9BACT|nr:hypothetical protein [Spirosoma profusum]MBD2700545.1 hypothetical protein [Spirosoma profusum]
MNTTDNQTYDPAEDDNQGVVQLLAQGETAKPGAAQVKQMSPESAMGADDKKDSDSPEVERNNDDVLAEDVPESGEQLT